LAFTKAHAVDAQLVGARARWHDLPPWAHAKAVYGPLFLRLVIIIPDLNLDGQAVVGHGYRPRPSTTQIPKLPELNLVDEALRMLDAKAHGNGFALEVHAVPHEALIEETRRMANGQHNHLGLYRFRRCRVRCDDDTANGPVAAHHNVLDARTEAKGATQVLKMLAELTQDAHKAVSAKVRLAVDEDALGRALRHQRLEHCAHLARIFPDSRRELAVAPRARSALTVA
jgi:hypothetical protein